MGDPGIQSLVPIDFLQNLNISWVVGGPLKIYEAMR